MVRSGKSVSKVTSASEQQKSPTGAPPRSSPGGALHGLTFALAGVGATINADAPRQVRPGAWR
jgi:hypothetical protein